MYVVADDRTAEHPILPAPTPPAARGRLETLGLVAGSILSGALAAAILWWLCDPDMSGEATANIIFMTLTSGAVVGLIYAMNRGMVRRTEERLRYAIEIQGQASRAQMQDVQFQIAAGREEGRRSRRALSMQIGELPQPRTRTRKPPAKRSPNIDTEHRWLSEAVEAGKELERQRRANPDELI